jgi:hypothetical protein
MQKPALAWRGLLHALGKAAKQARLTAHGS